MNRGTPFCMAFALCVSGCRSIHPRLPFDDVLLCAVFARVLVLFVLGKGGDVRLWRSVWRHRRLDVRGVNTALGGGTLAAVWGGDVIVLQVRV